MSKKQKKTPKEFKYTTSQTLPKIKTQKIEWDLKRLYYSSEKNPQIEKDIQKTERAYETFAKKFHTGKWRKTNKTIFVAVTQYIALITLPGNKPAHYLSYRKELNAEDTIAEKMLNKLDSRLTAMGNKILFFELQLAVLPKKLQKKLLTDKQFIKYRYYLKTVFEDAKYQLTEPEEKILNLKSNTSRGMWIAGTDKIINKRTIHWRGETMPINGALMQFENLPRKERHQMWSKIKPVLEDVGEIAENELVALVHDKKISDDLRGYKNPYSATTRGYDSTDKTLEKLVSVIESRGYALSKRFFKLKKKILGRDLSYIDRNESVALSPVISFETAVEIVRDVFYNFNPLYGNIFDEMLTSGQIDVWPKQGKGGGAFCSSGVKLPTLVLLNHNNSVESLRTLAHEMGHAIHAYRSKTQPALHEGHSILTAETASTFFESLVAEHLLSIVPEAQKVEFLNAFIGDKIGTMIMCIARFKFELEMHQTIRSEGGMSFKEMATGLSAHFGNYCGSAIDMEYTDGFIVAAKPHYRMNFYQYSYSFGEIGSSIMRSRFNQDPSYKKEVDTFLRLGDSGSVEDIFKTIGIDMSKEKTFHEGLDLLEADINAFELLAEKKK